MRGNMGDVHLKETATSRRISPFVILPLDIRNENRLHLVFTSDQTVVLEEESCSVISHHLPLSAHPSLSALSLHKSKTLHWKCRWLYDPSCCRAEEANISPTPN